jgi:hypothetical protein
MSNQELLLGEANYQAPRLIEIPGHTNETGSVNFWENIQLFPQGILRCFWISGVKGGKSRGNHAHLQESQVLIAVAGKLQIKVKGIDKEERIYSLDGPGVGLLVPPLNWVEIFFSDNAILLGLGDRYFSEHDFIRDKNDFENLR